eukprot:gene18460-24942_t
MSAMLKSSNVCRQTLSRDPSSRMAISKTAVPSARVCSPSSAKPSLTSRRDMRAQAQRRSPNVTPDVVVGKGQDEQHLDLYNYLLRQRIIFLGGYVNDKMATQIVGSLLALEQLDEEEEIRIYINSTGGQPYSIFGVLDTMKSIKPPIQTVALGACYSYASLLLAEVFRQERLCGLFSVVQQRLIWWLRQYKWRRLEGLQIVISGNSCYVLLCGLKCSVRNSSVVSFLRSSKGLSGGFQGDMYQVQTGEEQQRLE